MNWIRRLFCKHTFIFVRNIHGDEVIEYGWKRSIWACSRCGKVEPRAEMHKGVGERV